MHIRKDDTVVVITGKDKGKKGKVIKATPIAGDCIVEIQFDRVGVKKTMANYAPLKKLTEE
mgnify:CR=1 FL=1